MYRNREEPIGYKLSLVQFDGKGSPVELANSTTAATDIVSNPDLSACPDSCFRPVGLAWDSEGRLYMSSDSTGEIFVVTREDGSGIADVSEAADARENESPTPSGTGGVSTPTETSGAALNLGVRSGSYLAAGVAVVGALL